VGGDCNNRIRNDLQEVKQIGGIQNKRYRARDKDQAPKGIEAAISFWWGHRFAADEWRGRVV